MNARTNIFIACLFLLTPEICFTQILNAEKFGQRTDTSKALNGMLDVGLNITKEKEILLNLHTKSDLSYYFRDNLLLLAGSFHLFQSGAEDLINGGYAHLRYRHKFMKKWVPEIFMQIQYDQVKGLTERYLAGGGMRLRAWRSENSFLYLGTGLMYEQEKWHAGLTDIDPPPANPVVLNRLLKFTSYASFSLPVSKHLDWQLVIYYQTRPDKFWTFPRISGETNFSFKITKTLQFIIYLSGAYDAAPPIPIEKFYFTNRNQLRFIF